MDPLLLVDPKKVELTLYNKIERHFLAKLPDTDEAIITDTTKVINTLNSLCIEMDKRYELLKDAMEKDRVVTIEPLELGVATSKQQIANAQHIISDNEKNTERAAGLSAAFQFNFAAAGREGG